MNSSKIVLCRFLNGSATHTHTHARTRTHTHTRTHHTRTHHTRTHHTRTHHTRTHHTHTPHAHTHTHTHTHTNECFKQYQEFYYLVQMCATRRTPFPHVESKLGYISLSRNAMVLMGQYECHGHKHLQYETTWLSSSEHLELSRRKGSKRLRKLRQKCSGTRH
jgi:hypothetical protein